MLFNYYEFSSNKHKILALVPKIEEIPRPSPEFWQRILKPGEKRSYIHHSLTNIRRFLATFIILEER